MEIRAEFRKRLMRWVNATSAWGGNDTHPFNIRVVAATSGGLRELAERKLFRPLKGYGGNLVSYEQLR